MVEWYATGNNNSRNELWNRKHLRFLGCSWFAVVGGSFVTLLPIGVYAAISDQN